MGTEEAFLTTGFCNQGSRKWGLAENRGLAAVCTLGASRLLASAGPTVSNNVEMRSPVVSSMVSTDQPSNSTRDQNQSQPLVSTEQGRTRS